MLVVLLAVVWASNKTICGWACQLGLLQDLLYSVPVRKWRPPFWLANTIRGVAFAGLLLGLLVAGMDWIGWINPFQMFRIEFTWAIGGFAAILLIASLFIYRPWCQFLCPFGFVSWLVEQFSLLRPRINWEVCKKCQLCVKACPTRAMADFYSGKKIHADCFACGACFTACPQRGALRWQRS
jgi:polyferredoxin